MRWIKPSLKNSLYSLLGSSPPASDSMLEEGIEGIRVAMLDCLGKDGASRFPQVTRRVRYADDIQGLWYLRGDLMAALSAMHGESGAADRIATITEMFQGLLPGGLNSRPSPLRG